MWSPSVRELGWPGFMEANVESRAVSSEGGILAMQISKQRVGVVGSFCGIELNVRGVNDPRWKSKSSANQSSETGKMPSSSMQLEAWSIL